MPPPNHHVNEVQSIVCGIVTVSDTRTPATDKSGALLVELLTAAGHQVKIQKITPDEAPLIQREVIECCEQGCQAIILTGGTGIAPRDVTVEALTPLLEKQLDGFAEFFRRLSFEEIGPRAMLSRALAGTRGKTIIFSLPGSPAAVELAVNRLILPIFPHAAALLRT